MCKLVLRLASGTITAVACLTLSIPIAAGPASALPKAIPLESHTLQCGGLERRYWLHQPPQPAPRAGIVFVLHGSNDDGPGIRELLGRRLEALTDRAGFFVV